MQKALEIVMMEIVLQEDRIEGPPRKRLLTDQNPKQTIVTESPESTVSFDSSSDRLAKKTRELPNLSDCHSCGVRINYTNPRERLQPLESMWRVVLLCKKCTKRVSSSKLCTYCFSAVVDDKDCFKCRNCKHSVHKDCVAKYGSGLGFSVCVDCWVPDAVAKSIRARKRKLRKKNDESCEQTATLPESRVSIGETNEPNSFVKDMERKVAAAAKASENALRKAVVAKNAVELAKGVLSVVAGRKVAGGCETKLVDDAELAFLLHRAINSSSRTSRFNCVVSSSRRDDASIICYSRRGAGNKTVLMNSSSLDAPLIYYSRRRRKSYLRNSASLDAQLLCYSRRRSGSKACSHDIECDCFICKASKRTDKHGSTSSAGLKLCDRGYNSENSLSGNKCQEKDEGSIDSESHRYLLKYYRIGKGIPRSSFFIEGSDCSCMDSANLFTEGMSDTRNFRNDNECHETSKNYVDNTNRFFLKYKRSLSHKPKFSCKVEELSPMIPLNHPVEPTTLSNTRLPFSSQREL